MARMIKVTGVQQVIANLKKSTNRLGIGVARGLKKGGLLLQRESQKIVPVQVGDLHNAAFTRNVGGTGFRTDIVVGYAGVDYAVYVHEMVGELIKWSRAGSGAKFLESAVKRNAPEIVRLISASMKTGK